MTGIVACFSGRIASGKTSVTRQVAQTLGWPCTTFSDHLRHLLAEQGNINPSREDLQDLGQKLVATDPRGFCREVLERGHFVSGGNFVLDGIRHVDIYRHVGSLVVPSHCCLIHLAAPDEAVEKRVIQRGTSTSEFLRAESHTVESELATSLPLVADCVVDASLPLESVLELSLDAIKRYIVNFDATCEG